MLAKLTANVVIMTVAHLSAFLCFLRGTLRRYYTSVPPDTQRGIKLIKSKHKISRE